jgi:GAF domain-containing protein/biotin carboxyl carrier protein
MPEGGRSEELAAGAQAVALAELALCENLAQTSGWAAKWSAEVSGADAALLWAPDTVHPLFLCIGAHGAGTGKALRRAVGRTEGVVRALIRDRRPIALDRAALDAAAADPWLQGIPPDAKACLAVPLEAEGVVVGLLALLFREPPAAEAALPHLEGFLKHAVPALARALRSERKTVGMLHAIERLTNLYDLSKAFGSTIDLAELDGLIARKAADLAAAETASVWLLAGDELRLAATAHNENYDVENAPAAVGGPIVGDLVADRETVVMPQIPAGHPLRGENPSYELRNVMAIPLIEEDAPVGALVLANKRGRHPEFSPEDVELLVDLGRQAVRAIRVARQHEAEKKVEELDALLAVSREITATLDLDKVMRTIVNATAALIRYDRCAIAVQDRGRLRLGAVSGVMELDRKKPDIRSTEELLQWVFLSGADVAVTEEEGGRLVTDRPETEEKFRAFFQERGLKSFFGVLLKDEEGKLGVLGFESKEPIVFDEETRDLLQILVNQATVAVRNAQLYRQVPLVGFWKPLLEKRRKLLDIPKQRRLAWGAAAAILFVVLFLVPWRFRIGGPARILPARRAAVTAGVGGIVASVHRREGETVQANEVIATLKDEEYQAALADALADSQIADGEVARYREAGDATAMFAAQSRRDEIAARMALAREEMNRTRLVAPTAGVILTPRLEERVGQRVERGAEFAVVGDVGAVTAEVAIPEQDAAYVRVGAPVALKLNPLPTRTFHATVTRVGARIREEGEDRYLVAEVRVDNADGALKAGMVGRGKIRSGNRSIAVLLLRRPARWIYNKVWPLLP